MYCLSQTSQQFWEVDTVIYSHFMGQKTEAHLSRASNWQNWDSTWNFGTKDQAANLIHPQQVDANIIPILWKGKLRMGAIW